MRWPPWAPKSPNQLEQEARGGAAAAASKNNNNNNNDADNHNYTIDWRAFTEPRTLIATTILTTGILGAMALHGRYFRWFPDAVSISPSYMRRRSILGKVTSVGDGDNFRIYHTPGGRLAGWGWLPWKKIPTSKKELRDKTIHIRLAGIDAPELAHFGRPAQPFSKEAHEWLTAYVSGRRVRAYVHRHDQYQRVVATVVMRRALDFPIPFRRRDVSYEMLKKGLATVYEAKSGSEFGGAATERKYRQAEWWAKLRGLGLWKGFRRNNEWESPREYKTRMGLEDPIQLKAEAKKK